MKCDEIRERMPDVAAGFSTPTADEAIHIESCAACAEELKSMRATMALLDEWQVPEPSPYFDTRLQARLREEMAKPQGAAWLQWFRRPVLAAALTVLMGVGIGTYFLQNRGDGPPKQIVDVVNEPGSAASDLSALDKNTDLYSDFELLDDLSVQQDVTANSVDN
jgi:anti-sigma-K factor RskA